MMAKYTFGGDLSEDGRTARVSVVRTGLFGRVTRKLYTGRNDTHALFGPSWVWRCVDDERGRPDSDMDGRLCAAVSSRITHRLFDSENE